MASAPLESISALPAQLPLPPCQTCTVAVIGVGYVGLPLALAFGTPATSLQRPVLAFDLNRVRLAELERGLDRTREASAEELAAATLVRYSADPADLAVADVFIVTVPTPVDSSKRPDLSPLKRASTTVGEALKARAVAGASTLPVVIYESTVYPGATEEVCVPILERASGLAFNAPQAQEGFVCGYSPERINPGDNAHKLTTIVKVTSGSTSEVAEWVDALYASIIPAGTHRAASMKVAEAAKVIENTQRDLNIALVNELALIFQRLGIDTLDVLEAAGTKWNFLPFRPGLVGGHCIGVDPYYLTHKAEQEGYHPQVVLAGRRINDGMGSWVVDQLVMVMARQGRVIGGSRVLVLGFAFKENCPDLRNTRVVDVVQQLERYGVQPLVVDPWVDPAEAWQVYGLKVQQEIPAEGDFPGVIVAVSHREFQALSVEHWRGLMQPQGVLLDLKGIVPRELGPLRI
jgi:UDP-N-acetyl-D-galactosamine dehydrogenase